MRFKPHDYQRFAIEFIKAHPVAALLLDMGLGKTVITLTAIADLLFDSFEVSRVLVIAPVRVARDTWAAGSQTLREAPPNAPTGQRSAKTPFDL